MCTRFVCSGKAASKAGYHVMVWWYYVFSRHCHKGVGCKMAAGLRSSGNLASARDTETSYAYVNNVIYRLLTESDTIHA